jgi:hypothetical protein
MMGAMDADTGDFEEWRDELIDSPKSAENLIVRLDAALVRAGFELLAEAVPCVFCGRPSRWRDPKGVVRHPRCPMTERESARSEQARELEAQLRAETDKQRQIQEHLQRRRKREPPP